jgi:hypothetical protein
VTSPEDPEPGATLREVRLDLPADRPTGRVYRTPNGKLEAGISPEGVLVRRPEEPQEPEVLIRWPDLALVARALRRWAVIRDAWAAYFVIPLFMSVKAVHWPAGHAADRAAIGPRTQRPWGSTCVRYGGTRELRPRSAPHALSPGIDLLADLWRRESTIGPRDGEKVGERWRVGGRLIVDVRRLEARSHHGTDLVRWTVAETEVPAALLALRPPPPGEA